MTGKENNISRNNRPDILCFSSTDWEGVWGSRQQVMLRFANRGYRVLFIERPVGLEHLLRYPAFRRRKFRRWREGMQSINEKLWIVSLPPLLPGKYYSVAINRINQWLTKHWSRRYQTDLGFISPILWLYNVEHGPLLKQFNERLSVYHCIDERTVGCSGRKRRTISALEADLLQRVDLVFANSVLTYENKRRFNSRTYRIPSGADVEHFAQALDPTTPVHPDMAPIPQPRIGYSGHINERLDYSVLEHLALQRPDWSLVFVGDTYPWTLDTPPLPQLKAMPNVYFLGNYPFTQMPSLLKGMDICLLPYVSDERGRYRSPLKLYEYLAAGKPVVSTDHPEAREFSSQVYIASNPEDFLNQVYHALTEDDPARKRQRVAIAKQNSWDCRVDKMEQIIYQTLGSI